MHIYWRITPSKHRVGEFTTTGFVNAGTSVIFGTTGNELVLSSISKAWAFKEIFERFGVVEYSTMEGTANPGKPFKTTEA